MDISAKYKQQVKAADQVQEIWVPEIGDFWYCSCESCLSYDRAWILEQADVLCIDPTADLKNYYRDVQMAAHTSLDCGFGAYWRDLQENGHRSMIWLPRFDQIMQIAQNTLFADLDDLRWAVDDPRWAFNVFTLEWQRSSFWNSEYDTMEQAALAWLVKSLKLI